MGTTTFSGPVRSGTLKTGETNGPNLGFAVLEQETSITQNSTTAVSSTLYIPVGSKIINILVDVLTAFNSASSAVLSVGTAAAGTQYASGVDVKTATGRPVGCYVERVGSGRCCTDPRPRCGHRDPDRCDLGRLRSRDPRLRSAAVRSDTNAHR
jgi:hypothetical protein